jgi:hypothetical protein
MSSTGTAPPAKTACWGLRGTRDLDRYLYGTLAGVLGLLVFAGFARTYYLKFLFASPLASIPTIRRILRELQGRRDSRTRS